MIKYVFREGVPIVGFKNKDKADPQKLGEAFDKARKQAHRTGEDVRALLERQARRKGHAYYQHLEWDDEVCGVKYRMEQIAGIGSLISIVDEETNEQVPAFISVVAAKTPRQFYQPQEIANSRNLQEAAYDAAYRDLLAFERRFRWMQDICADIAEIREKIARRSKRYKGADEGADERAAV